MQYKINLPRDYNMDIIRQRVRDNGHKTDGFPGLLFKAYLITEAEKNRNLYNSYAPLYIWNASEGMNRFIFEGFYDNILASFGWQQINIGVPYSIHLNEDFDKSRYVVEITGTLPERKSLLDPKFQTANQYVSNVESFGELIIYNPDKWEYSHYSFYHEKPEIQTGKQLTVYQILHISQ